MTPGSVDPSSTAYRVHAHAFNALTTMLAGDPFIPLSVRDAIAGAIVEAIEPIIRADERKPFAALATDMHGEADDNDCACEAKVLHASAARIRQLLGPEAS